MHVQLHIWNNRCFASWKSSYFKLTPWRTITDRSYLLLFAFCLLLYFHSIWKQSFLFHWLNSDFYFLLFFQSLSHPPFTYFIFNNDHLCVEFHNFFASPQADEHIYLSDLHKYPNVLYLHLYWTDRHKLYSCLYYLCSVLFIMPWIFVYQHNY